MGEEENVEPTEAKEVEEENTSKIARKRKKHLYNSIKDLMEFWFSDVNLGKDRFLTQLVFEDPWVDLETFMKFNKLRALTSDINDVIKALRKSEMLQVSEDGRKVCRTTPMEKKSDVDACTIYVEQFPQDAEHDWLKSVFSEYGPIDYISLPRFKATQKPKGFAFIEYKDPESANRAIEAFRAKGCCLSPQMDPDKLMSIATFDKNEEQYNKVKLERVGEGDEELKYNKSKKDKNREQQDNQKTNYTKNGPEENEIQPEEQVVDNDLKPKKSKKDKNMKQENCQEPEGAKNETEEKKISKTKQFEQTVEDDEDLSIKKSKKVKNIKNENDEETENSKFETGEKSKKKHKSKIENNIDDNVNEEDDSVKEKKSSKRKRKSSETNEDTDVTVNKSLKRSKSISECDDSKDNERNKNAAEEESDSTNMEFAEQSENVEDCVDKGENEEKRKKRKRKKKHKKQTNVISLGLQIMPKVEWKSLRNKYLNLQKQKMQHLKQHLRQSQWEQRKPKWQTPNYKYEENVMDVDKNVQDKKKGLEFTPGVIIKVSLDEPVCDVRGMKIEARINPEIRYVDATEGDSEIYLRVGGPELVEQVLNAKKWANMEVLKGKEEKAYWDKIMKEREEKFSKKIRSNLRGRDKLLKKAEKFQGKHIGFDEH